MISALITPAGALPPMADTDPPVMPATRLLFLSKPAGFYVDRER